MKVPDRWIPFVRTDHRRYMLHLPPDKTRSHLKTLCGRAWMFQRSVRTDIPDTATMCRGCASREHYLIKNGINPDIKEYDTPETRKAGIQK